MTKVRNCQEEMGVFDKNQEIQHIHAVYKNIYHQQNCILL